MNPEERIKEIIEVVRKSDGAVDKDWLIEVLTAPVFSEWQNRRLEARLRAAQEELKVTDETLDRVIESETEYVLENIRLISALRNLVYRLDEIINHKDFISIFHVAQIHGAPYNGPVVTAELTYAKELLKKVDPDYKDGGESA